AGNTMDEYGADHHGCGSDADERPGGSVPDVQQTDVRVDGRALLHRVETPFHVHPFLHAASVAKSHRRALAIDLHLRKPPGGPVEQPEWAICGHRDDAAAVRRTLAEPNGSVVRQ